MNESSKISKIINEQGFIIYAPKGTSMLPLFEEGECLVKLVKPFAGIKVNDVVLFRRKDGTNILHRVVKKYKNSFLICGDNCTKGELVESNQIIAIMDGYYIGERYYSCNDESYKEYVSKIKKCSEREIIQIVPNEWSEIINLVKYSAFELGTYDIQKKVDWNKLYSIAKKHRILSTAFLSINKSECPIEIYNKWKNSYYQNIKRTILFDGERNILTKKFESEKIKYICLKGIVIKDLYPKQGMREFADNDILIEVQNIERAKCILSSLGYDEICESECHIACHKKPCFNFEIHKQLIPQRIKHYDYFDDVFERSYHKDNNEYEYFLTDDDFYIYFIMHFYKHYSYSGCGIRQFVDLYLIRDKFVNLNYEYIENELKSIELYNFHNDIIEIMNRIFFDFENLDYEKISYIFDSGVFGLTKFSIWNTLKEQRKSKYVFNRIFLPYKSMLLLYPLLTKVPWLLPICWINRILKTVAERSKRQRIINEIKTVIKY